jgi:hypothetical protein
MKHSRAVALYGFDEVEVKSQLPFYIAESCVIGRMLGKKLHPSRLKQGMQNVGNGALPACVFTSCQRAANGRRSLLGKTEAP